MHAIYVRDLRSRQPGIPLAVDIEDAVLAERLVRSIAGSYRKNGCEAASAYWFRDGEGLHRIWAEPFRGAVARGSDRAAAA